MGRQANPCALHFMLPMGASWHARSPLVRHKRLMGYRCEHNRRLLSESLPPLALANLYS